MRLSDNTKTLLPVLKETKSLEANGSYTRVPEPTRRQTGTQPRTAHECSEGKDC